MSDATITCSRCKAVLDKGAPAQLGQNDKHFVCDDCQAAADAKAIAEASPTISASGKDLP